MENDQKFALLMSNEIGEFFKTEETKRTPKQYEYINKKYKIPIIKKLFGLDDVLVYIHIFRYRNTNEEIEHNAILQVEVSIKTNKPPCNCCYNSNNNHKVLSKKLVIGYIVINNDYYDFCLKTIINMKEILQTHTFSKTIGKIISVSENNKLTVQSLCFKDVVEIDFCCVCYEDTFTKTLCNHSVCIPCWLKIKKHQNQIVCPICKSDISLIEYVPQDDIVRYYTEEVGNHSDYDEDDSQEDDDNDDDDGNNNDEEDDRNEYENENNDDNNNNNNNNNNENTNNDNETASHNEYNDEIDSETEEDDDDNEDYETEEYESEYIEQEELNESKENEIIISFNIQEILWWGLMP